MLDQSFSVQNFRKIYDYENRRGRNVDHLFFPDLVDSSAKISAKSESIREVRRANKDLEKAAVDALLSPLYAELAVLRSEREAVLEAQLELIAGRIASKGYKLNLHRTVGPSGMTLYPIAISPSSYFVGKQLQRNIRKLYKLRPGDRRMIVSQIKDTLTTNFPMYVVKTDISSFYESIDRKILLKNIDHDQLLSLSSKSHIKCILAEFERLSTSPLGIPRGVGVSAYLSELYMRSVDEHIAQLPGLTYYARYVDDILAIFSPTAMDDVSSYVPAITAALAAKGLTPNPIKSKDGPTGGGGVLNFEYLGYAFNVAGGACRLEMSSRKVARYKARIDACFAKFEDQRCLSERAAFRALVARIKFLTGNTRLLNSKRHAHVGIYFSNSHLTEYGKLSGLDAYLRHKIKQLGSAKLQDSLDSYSFVMGFTERPFYRYSTREITKITKAWKYEA